MNTLLALETSCNACSVAISCGETDNEPHLMMRHADMARGQSEQLFKMLGETVEEWKGLVNSSEGFVPDSILITCGPGAFTGIRIGLSAARGLALAYGCKIVGLSTMDVMLASMQSDIIAHSKPALLLMETKRADFYAVLSDQEGNRIGSAFTILPEQLEEYGRKRFGEKPFFLLGDGAIRASRSIECSDEQAMIPDWNQINPTATSLIELYKRFDDAGVDFNHPDFQPKANYIRPPDAALSQKERRVIGDADLKMLLS